MKSTALSLLILLTFLACAQKNKNVSPLTDAEKLGLRNKQIAYINAQQAYMNTPEYKAFLAAQEGINKAVDDLYKTRQITSADYVLCDGPNATVCAGLAVGTIELKEVPKPKADATKK